MTYGSIGLLLILLTFSHNNGSDTDYCADEYRCEDGTVEHTGCNCSYAEQCGPNSEAYEPTDDIRYDYVRQHNDYREKIASGNETRGGIKAGATLMYALQYDKELEYLANCWNKRCIVGHDDCSKTKKFPGVGQNRQDGKFGQCEWNKSIRIALNQWYEEINLMNETCFAAYFKECANNKAGHFVQMIWAKTTHVGCSVLKSTKENQCFIMCDYGPTGNIRGMAPFESGTPASKCEFKSKKYAHLCLLTEDQDEGNYAGERNSSSKFTILLMLIYVLLK